MGITPGGATPASFMSYGLAKRFSKNGDKFGKGELEGVVAPETAAHAAGTSALLPMLTLGIPGSPTAAVLLGGLLIWGLQPGPLLFVEQKEFVWGLIASMYLGNIAGPDRRADLRAAVRRDPAHPVQHHRAGDPGDLRRRRLHRQQRDVRRLADAGLRRRRLRFQEAGLSAARRWCWRSCSATWPRARSARRCCCRRASLSIFWSNWLVGSIMSLGLVLLLWPLVSWAMSMLRRTGPVSQGRLEVAGATAPRKLRLIEQEQERGSNKWEMKHAAHEYETSQGGRRRWRCRRVGLRGRPAADWQPTKPVTFVVPAGTGGGADQMARFIQGIVTKHNLMKQPLVVVNKAGGAGAEGFLDVKASARRSAQDHHHAVQPLHDAAGHRHAVQLEGSDAGLDAGARPVRALGERRVALQDREGISRRGEGRRRPPVQDGRHRLEAGRSDHHRRAGAADRRRSSPTCPITGGGDVAVQLVGKHVDSTVNNPIEAVAQWKAGALRPLCIFDEQAQHVHRQGDGRRWPGATSRPARKRASNVEYQMLRGIFMPPGVKPDQVDVLRRAVQEGACRRRTGRSSWSRAHSTRPP